MGWAERRQGSAGLMRRCLSSANHAAGSAAHPAASSHVQGGLQLGHDDVQGLAVIPGTCTGAVSAGRTQMRAVP